MFGEDPEDYKDRKNMLTVTREISKIDSRREDRYFVKYKGKKIYSGVQIVDPKNIGDESLDTPAFFKIRGIENGEGGYREYFLFPVIRIEENIYTIKKDNNGYLFIDLDKGKSLKGK